MKVLFCLLLLSAVGANAQVSYTSSNYASVADSYLVSNAVTGISGFDFSVTDSNYTWDYSDLPVQNQEIRSFFNPDSGGYKPDWCIENEYVLTCTTNFNALTNLATYGVDSLSLGPASVSNVVNHYRKTSGYLEYTMVGYTISLGSVPVAYPIQYTTPDSIYRFPFVYGNADSAHSLYSINLSGSDLSFTSSTATYRRNYVDGWGKLVTPYATFPSVLKIKTILVTYDTVVSDSSEIYTTDTTIQYKWFDTSYGIPVLEADGTIISGTTLITSITYIDSARCLTPSAFFITNPVVPYYDTINKVCIVSFNNLSTNYDSCHWSLSNGSSSLDNPIDTFSCPGTYNIQLVVYNTCGAALSDTVTIPLVVHDTTGFSGVSVSVSGSSMVCSGDSVSLTGTIAGGYTYQWLDSGTAITGASSALYNAAVTGDYQLAITNEYGCTDTSATQTIVVTAYPMAMITPDGSISSCAGDSVTLATSSDSMYVYKWYRESFLVAGGSSAVYKATVSGDYRVVVRNGTCSDTSAAVTVAFSPVPAIYTVTGGGSYCTGGAGIDVGLSSSAIGVNYELYYDGAATGATVVGSGSVLSFGTVAGTGIYMVSATDSGTSCSIDMDGSATVTTTATVHPDISIIYSPAVVCVGDSVMLSATIMNGGPSPLYTWYINGIFTNSDSSFAVSPSGTDSVICLLFSDATCVDTNTVASSMVIITTDTIPVLSISILERGMATDNITDSFFAVVTGGCPDIAYQWLVNGSIMASATAATFTDTGLSVGDSVKCVTSCSNACGSAIASASVSVMGNELVATVANNQNITIDPNPCNGIFKINTPVAGTVYIYNMEGQMMFVTDVKAGNNSITPGRSLMPGLYTVILSGNNFRNILRLAVVN